MPEYVRMYRSVATSVLFGVVALLAGFSATADKAPDGQPFAATRGDRTSGWLAQTRSGSSQRPGIKENSPLNAFCARLAWYMTKAAAQGANAIVGLRYATPSSGNERIVLAYGTAVKVRKA